MKPIRLTPAIQRAFPILGLALLIACTTVPFTGRSQLTLLPEDQITQMSRQQYQATLNEAPVITGTAQAEQVERVGKRIAAAAEQYLRSIGSGDRVRDLNWEFALIDAPDTVNAWAMPGGKVAVYTGLLDVAEDDTGLSVVMAHEVAHVVARHGNERMSQQLVTQLGAMTLSEALGSQPQRTQELAMMAFGLGSTIGVQLPYSRTHELEADEIGLILMGLAGYDPREAIPFWQRMAAAGGGGGIEFLSTHPLEETRIQNLQETMDVAMEYYRQGQ